MVNLLLGKSHGYMVSNFLKTSAFEFCLFKSIYQKKKKKKKSSHLATVEMNPTRNHEVAGSICGLTQWVKDLALPRAVVAMSCAVGCRCGSDPTLLWLWSWPGATAPIRLLV